MVLILDKLREFQNNHPNIYIGGSVSLILQNAIPYRVPGDIDIISKEKIHIFDLFNINKSKLPLIKIFKYQELKYELFYNPLAEYVEYKWKDSILKLSPIEEVMLWKQHPRFINKQKHIDDIINKII